MASTTGSAKGMVRRGAFVTGSIPRHILVMTGTGALGLVAIFIGDLANILFLSFLGDLDIVAAVGYASSIMFLTVSVGIGLGIAATSLISPALGSGRRVRARRLTASAHFITGTVAAVVALAIWLAIPVFLTGLGATGHVHRLAETYLEILVPFLVPLALGMTSASVLRSVGDAQRAMYVTLTGAVVNIVLDPIFIFALGLGLEGAAWASALSRLAILAVGLHGVARVHDLLGRLKFKTLPGDARLLAAVAVPAILTNVATPAANAYVTAAIAPFGDEAVAGFAIVGRVMPVAFGAIYALSSSIGPIIGQNYGVRNEARMRETITWSLIVMAVFTLVAWIGLAAFSSSLVRLFHAEGKAADLMLLFCRWLAPSFVFLGMLFVANAIFNTLRHPHYATLFNWARATVGTVPFVLLGGWLAGAEGVLAGNMLGAAPFGIAAVWFAYRLSAQSVSQE
jgi:putative MATE family efflux protein